MSSDVQFGRVIALIDENGFPISNVEEAAAYGGDIYEIVISVGRDDSVAPEMRFVVFEEGEELFDPKSGGSLGQFEIVKGRGRAVHVQERMSRIRTTSTRKALRTNYLTMMGGNASPEASFENVAVPFKGVKIGDAVRPI